MQRDAEAGGRILQGDQLALGVPGIERLAGRIVPHHLDDVVDEFLRLLGAGDPLRGYRDGLGLADVGVGPLRHYVLGKEAVVLEQLIGLGPADRNQADAAGGRQLGDGAGRLAADEEVGVERPRSEEHTSETQSLMRTTYAVLRLKKKKTKEILI